MFYEYDVFICHASEDKAEVVEPLGQELLRARSEGLARQICSKNR